MEKTASMKDKVRQEGLIRQSVAVARLYQQTLEKSAPKCRNPRLQGISFFLASKKYD
jgi:hypothetical protein